MGSVWYYKDVRGHFQAFWHQNASQTNVISWIFSGWCVLPTFSQPEDVSAITRMWAITRTCSIQEEVICGRLMRFRDTWSTIFSSSGQLWYIRHVVSCDANPRINLWFRRESHSPCTLNDLRSIFVTRCGNLYRCLVDMIGGCIAP